MIDPFSGPGDIRALCRVLDWAGTPLGPVGSWPASLRLAVRMCLDARFPMAIWAGPERVLIYNDGYPPVVGPDRHPWALGRSAREVWADLWDRLAPELDAVFAGQSTVHEDERFVLRRHGREEEAYFTYSFTPIPADDGRIVGALNVFVETTERVHALQRGTALLEAISDSTQDAIFAKDRDGRVLFANPATLAVLGLPQEEVVGRVLPGPIADPSLRRWITEGDEEVLATGARVNTEIELTGPQRRVWSTVKSPHRDPSGRTIGVLVISRDITARKRTEEALRASEERFRTVVENSRDGINLLDLETGRYAFMSSAQVALTGFTAEELNELPAEEALARVHPEDREIARHQQQELAAGRERAEPAEYRWKVRSGEYRWFSDSRKLVRDARGRPVALVGVSRDITDRKRAEEALRQSQQRLERERARLQAIVDTIPVGLFVMEADGGVALSNDIAREIWGGIALAKSIAEYTQYVGYWPGTTEPLRPDEWPAAQALLHGRTTKDVVVDIDRFDGTRRTITVAGAPIRDEAGAVTGAVVAFHDISDLTQARARLEEQDRRKDEFLAMLSHELRNPLAPIMTSLHILDRVPPDSERAHRANEVIRRQVVQLSHLVDDLLDVTRITRGKIQLRLERVELQSLVQAATEDQRPLFDRAGVALDVTPGPPLLVDADRSRIAQVVGNLLQNAAKFTPRGGRVRVGVCADPAAQDAALTVEDDGAGMAPEVLDHLFEPFMQADHTLDRSRGGLGLGLALVKGLVALHGGSVTASSAGIGRGSRFEVRLPLHEAPRTVAAADGLATPRAERRRVLVIEDNVDAAASLRELIELFGHEVHVAHTGPDGIAKARDTRPHVVLCDIGLPGMDGYAVARALRADATLRDAQLVALSGYAQPEDLRLAAEAGFEHHVAKPPDLEALERILAGAAATAS